MKTSVPQVFEEVEKQTTKENRIKVLRAYDTQVLRGILGLNFDPNFNMDLPVGEPPFKKDKEVPAGYSETNLYVEWRRFYIWTEKNNLPKIRKEALFIQLLEGLHWTEAECVCLAKDKSLNKKYKSIKEDLVREAFPNFLPPPAPKTEVKVEKSTKKSSAPSKV